MAHFYTGQLRLARMCVLRSLMKRPSVSFFASRCSEQEEDSPLLITVFFYIL